MQPAGHAAVEVQLSAVEEPVTYVHVATELSTSVQKPAEEVELADARTQLTVSLATGGPSSHVWPGSVAVPVHAARAEGKRALALS